MVPELTLITEPAHESAPAPEFAAALSSLASGVVLVTCRVGGRPWGMTATAFASVSANPPIVLVSLCTEGTTATAIEASGHFAINILAEGQEPVARNGSAPGAPKFIDRLVVPGALAHLDCELSDAIEVADHTVFFGRVLSARVFHEGEALVYHRRAYRTVSDLETTEEMRCLSS